MKGVVILVAGLTACERPPAGCPAAPLELAAIAAAPPAALPPEKIDSTLSLALNIPAYRLDVSVTGQLRKTYEVAVGTRRYPTRTGDFLLESITWNPWWQPPPSPWARAEKLTPPGPANPMGKVKLNYSPSYYLHGTPDSLRLARAASHGCVRMQNQDAIDLAIMVHAFTGTTLSAQEQGELLAEWRTSRTIVLPRTVSLRVSYELAEVRDTLLYVFADIYEVGGRTDAIGAALVRAGLSTSRMDSSALRRLSGGAQTYTIHLDSLLSTN
jgi:murein L,D-transpeptidase YcbB/YkuD